jgi:hypothetical protein
MSLVGRIKIEYVEGRREVVITADAEGLQSLARACERIIGKEGPAAHWHFTEWFDNADPGSLSLEIRFEPSEELRSDER